MGREYIGKATINFLNFLKINGCSFFNIHFRWVVSIVWPAFDLIVTVVPLKVALGLEKINFWALKKKIKKVT